jgi:hypothetical protein
MEKRFLQAIVPALALPLALAFPALSQADFVSCTGTEPSYDISDHVTPSTDCAILAPENGNANDFTGGSDSSLWTVNLEAFFGYSDWLFDGKWQDVGGTMTYDGADLVSFDGTNMGGDWTLEALGFWSDHEHLMFVFKDGANTNLTAYLIETGATGGTYLTPFVNPPFNVSSNGREISHISVYYRGEGDTPPREIPEPALLVLFGTGLLAMGWMVRRRKEMNGLS